MPRVTRRRRVVVAQPTASPSRRPGACPRTRPLVCVRLPRSTGSSGGPPQRTRPGHRAGTQPGDIIRTPRLTAPLVLTALAAAALLLSACGSSTADGASPTPTSDVTLDPATGTPTATPTPEVTPTTAPALAGCIVDSERRPELTWIVDKEHPLPDGYAPDNLVILSNDLVAPGFEGRPLDAEAAEHFADLVAAARDAGYNIGARSTYRSYDEQVWTYAYWVEQLGQAEADRVSAKPGHSEHQLGLTSDTTSDVVGWELNEALGDTDQGAWLLANAYRFGFVESYPRDGEQITGYAYEPWHLRYMGVNCATAWHDSGLTPVEFLRTLPANAGQ